MFPSDSRTSVCILNTRLPIKDKLQPQLRESRGQNIWLFDSSWFAPVYQDLTFQIYPEYMPKNSMSKLSELGQQAGAYKGCSFLFPGDL